MLSFLRQAKNAVRERQLRQPAKPVSVRDGFAWPQGVAGAVSLSYDDGIANHLQVVMPQLEAVGLLGTFYPHIMSGDFQKDLAGWRSAATRGHELGNHTCFHPCRAKPGISRDFDLTHYTERRWCAEIELANFTLNQLDGNAQRTFGNTCWDNWIGPDENALCLEQLAARYFPAARGERRDEPVDPKAFNFYNLGTRSADGLKFPVIRDAIESAAAKGQWLILTMHGVGQGSHKLFIETDDHLELTRWLAGHADHVWSAPVIKVADWLKQKV